MDYKRNAAVLAVLVLAVVLMVWPPLIAVISMIDPGALDGAATWLQRLSPVISYLDYVKAAMTLIAAIVIWRAEAWRALESPADPEQRSSSERLRRLQVRPRPSSSA